jgi:hypothetical protein
VNNSRMSFLYSQNPSTGLTTYLTNGHMQFRFSKTDRLELRGGLSREVSGTGRNNGYASGINYYNRSQRWELGLNNYFSSAFYSGLQRGVSLLDERLSYSLNDNMTVYSRFNYNKNAPGYQDGYVLYGDFGNKLLSYEAGLNFMYGSVNVGIKPYVLRQGLTRPNVTGSGLLDLSARSYRSEFALSFNASGNQFMFLVDYGLMHTISVTDKQSTAGLKVNASMNNRFFSLTALIQTAPYYLTDLSTTYRPNEKFSLYTVGPGLHVNAFKDRMNLSANYYLSYYSSTQGLNNALTGHANVRIRKSWELTGQVSYNSNTYSPGSYNLQSQLGVVKHFSRSTSPGNAKLDVEFYSDDNGNGVWDRNEDPIQGVIANLSTEGTSATSALATISNNKGKISYVNLKKEIYSLQIAQAGDQHLGKPVHVLLSENKKIQVPLIKSGWLKGRINAVKQEYIAAQPALEGMRIIAKDAHNQTFETYTNELGEFRIPLPLNEYTIVADVDPEKYTSVNTKEVVRVKQRNNRDIQFDIMDHSRKVIVKEF